MTFYEMLMAQMNKDAQMADMQPQPGSALADYGRQFLNNLNPPASINGGGLPELNAGGLNMPAQGMDYLTKALPFGAGAALPFAGDIYSHFWGEDQEAQQPLPPSMEAIVREANQGRPTGTNDPLTHTFDMGSLPPEELFRLSLGGGGSGIGMGSYQQLAQQLPQPEMVTREMAPPTDFSAADAAMAEAKPQEYTPTGGIGQILQGMAQAGMRGIGGDTGDFLLALGLGAMGGLGSGMDLETERKDLANERMREYQLKNAGYQSDKASVGRQEKQQGFDATYESQVNYNAAKAMRQQQVVDLLSHGLDQQAMDARSSRSEAVQMALHNQEMALKRWEMSQPSVEANQYGLVTTATDPKTGKRTMTIDNSPWVQKLQMQAMMRQTGGLSGMPGMDFGDNSEIDANELTKRLSTYYYMNPMALEQDLGSKFMTSATEATKSLVQSDSKQFPQMMANNIYAYIAKIIQNGEDDPLYNSVMNRMAMMQGMF